MTAVIAIYRLRRVGIYASLDDALDKKRRHLQPIGTVFIRVVDGAILAKIIHANQRKVDDEMDLSLDRGDCGGV
jgi:hypothetical protein